MRPAHILFLALLLLPAACAGEKETPPTCYDPPALTVHASIDQASLKTAAYQQRGIFWVNAKITNTGETKQNIAAWTQYGWSWVSSQPKITAAYDALENAPAGKTLAPHESYTRRVEMLSEAKDKALPERFQLGFIPRSDLPEAGVLSDGATYPLSPTDAAKHKPDLGAWGGVFWSNPMVLAAPRQP